MGGIFGDAALADIEGFCLAKGFVTENDPAEVGFALRLFIPQQGALHMVVERYRVVQDGEDFHVVVMVVGQHFVDVFLHPRNLFPIVGKIVLNDGKSLQQVGFFSLP